LEHVVSYAELRRLTIQAAKLVDERESLAVAVADDLGESPEAIRGALLICETIRGIAQAMLRRDIPDEEQESESEMQAMGAVIMGLAMAVHERLTPLLPRENPE